MEYVVIFIYTKKEKVQRWKEKKNWETNLTVLDIQILKHHQIEICIAHQESPQHKNSSNSSKNEECDTTKYWRILTVNVIITIYKIVERFVKKYSKMIIAFHISFYKYKDIFLTHSTKKWLFLSPDKPGNTCHQCGRD